MRARDFEVEKETPEFQDAQIFSFDQPRHELLRLSHGLLVNNAVGGNLPGNDDSIVQ